MRAKCSCIPLYGVSENRCLAIPIPRLRSLALVVLLPSPPIAPPHRDHVRFVLQPSLSGKIRRTPKADLLLTARSGRPVALLVIEVRS